MDHSKLKTLYIVRKKSKSELGHLADDKNKYYQSEDGCLNYVYLYTKDLQKV